MATEPLRGDGAARLAWLDAARGLGIVLVVAGHTFNDPLIRSPIFLFHMPLFFLLAGYTMKAEPFGGMFVKRVRSLLVPYLSFFVLVTAIDVALGRVFDHPVSLDWNHPLGALGTALYGGQMLKGSYAVFWFITCLFAAQMVFGWLLARLPDLRDLRWAAILLACLGLTCLAHRLSPSPWNIAVAPAALLFLYAGQALRRHGDAVPWPADLAAAAAAIGSLFVAAPLDMKYALFGTPVVSLIAAALLSYSFIRACQLLARIPVLVDGLVWLGQASLTVMFLHMTIIFHFHARLGAPLAFVLAGVLPLLLYPVIRASALGRRLLLGGR
ncbi:MAG: acyltransferase family protein [Alphaproteobacteria bacterium]|nr:acyltransferase family protein [Alphaproteobacteria bacterium]